MISTDFRILSPFPVSGSRLEWRRTCVAAALLCAGVLATPALSQGTDSTPAGHSARCEKLAVPDRARMSVRAYRTALSDLPSCTEQGARILASLWQTPSPPEVGYLRIASLENPDDRILREVIRVAHDPAQSEALRLEAAQVMMGYAMPAFHGIHLDADTTTPKDIPDDVLKQDVRLRYRWVSIAISPHHYSDRHLPNARALVINEFGNIISAEPNTRFGHVTAVLLDYLQSWPDNEDK